MLSVTESGSDLTLLTWTCTIGGRATSEQAELAYRSLNEALVEHGTYAIDETSLGDRTVDKVQWEGTFFSSKPPLLPTMCAPLYAVVKTITGQSFEDAMYPTVRRMRLFVAVLPWVGAMLLFIALARRSANDSTNATFIAIAMMLGGLPTAYASHLDNHSFAFLCLVGAALAASPLLDGDRRLTLGQAALVGLFGGAATAFDLGATPVVGGFALWILWTLRNDKTAAAVLVVAALVAPVCQTVIQYSMTGDIRPFYLVKSAYQYPGSYWGNPIEFDALREPKAVYGFHALLGHHGLFSVTPWMLLALPWFFQRERTEQTETLRRVAIATTAFVIGYYIYRTINYGGRCVGMRWFMVLHPTLAIAALRTVDRYDLVRRAPLWLGLLVGLSAVSALGGAINPWEEGFIYALFRAIGLGSVPG